MAIEKHGHQHCPGGPDEIPCLPRTIPAFVARQDAAFTTVTDGSDTVLLWDEWDNSDATVFSENTTGSPAKVTTVDLLLPGRYTLVCGVNWAANFNSQKQLILAGSYDFNNQILYDGRPDGGVTMTGTWSLLFPAPFEAGPTPPPWAQVQFQVAQNSGSSRDTDFGSFMQITFDGPTTHTPEQA